MTPNIQKAKKTNAKTVKMMQLIKSFSKSAENMLTPTKNAKQSPQMREKTAIFKRKGILELSIVSSMAAPKISKSNSNKNSIVLVHGRGLFTDVEVTFGFTGEVHSQRFEGFFVHVREHNRGVNFTAMQFV